MPKKSQSHLMRLALDDLEKLGYLVAYGREKGDGFGKSVEYFSTPDPDDYPAILVQCRSAQEVRGELYWLGFMPEDLRKVDRVVVWIEGQPDLFMFPASELQEMLSACPPGRQLQVNIDPSRCLLSPQNSRNRYDIKKYAKSIANPVRTQYQTS